MGNNRLKEDDVAREKARREESLQFVVSHYRHDAFNASRDWRALGLDRRPWLLRHAAAVAMWGVALAACAAVAVWMLSPAPAPAPAAPVPAEKAIPAAPASHNESRRIEFTDASFSEVAQAVEKVYGVRLADLPDSSERISLCYEGSAADLVETLNSLFGCHLRIVAPAPSNEADSTYRR